jgi:hypothetical protein
MQAKNINIIAALIITFTVTSFYPKQTLETMYYITWQATANYALNEWQLIPRISA